MTYILFDKFQLNMLGTLTIDGYTTKQRQINKYGGLIFLYV